MKYTLQKITHFDFFEQLEKFVTEIQPLHSSNELILKESIDEQIVRVKEFIANHINPNADEILSFLVNYYDKYDGYYSEYGTGKSPEIIKEINRIERFLESLKLTIRYLSIIDSLINSEKITIESISEKNDFILNKLNKLFSDDHYSISTILMLNDIKFRDGESREIAEDLNRRGYVILGSPNREFDYVKISVKGASYIERKNKQKKKNKENSELDKKIDNIMEHLIKLGCGQEIIFNEIDELKELQYKLSKKSWSQLLKGKLLDLALNKLISTETATSVYEYLTNHRFKLLQ